GALPTVLAHPRRIDERRHLRALTDVRFERDILLRSAHGQLADELFYDRNVALLVADHHRVSGAANRHAFEHIDRFRRWRARVQDAANGLLPADAISINAVRKHPADADRQPAFVHSHLGVGRAHLAVRDRGVAVRRTNATRAQPLLLRAGRAVARFADNRT